MAPTANNGISFNNGLKMYAGTSLGYGSRAGACNTPFFEGKCEDADFSWKVFGGARFNPMFGVELELCRSGTG
ncbi:MAG: hypothetical protein R3E95_06920 [Thiolinea sp.]